MTSTLVFSDPLSSKLQPSDPGLSSSHTTSLSLSSASGTTYKISSPPLPSSSPPRPHSPPASPSDSSSVAHSTVPVITSTSTTVTLSHEPTSLSDLITAEHNQSYSTTLVATFATAAPTSIDTEVGSVTTVPSALATLFSSSTLCGSVVTETVILNPTLSPNTGSGSVSQFSDNKGAITAVSIMIGLLVPSMVVWAFILYRRRTRKRIAGRDTTTAAMMAAGIRVPPLDDGNSDDDGQPMNQRLQSVFEDGTPVDSVIDKDLGGPFGPNPYLIYPEPILGMGSGRLHSPMQNDSMFVGLPSVLHPAGRMYNERSVNHARTSESSHRHEFHGDHSPTSGIYSPSTYPLLNGTFHARDPSKPISSEGKYAPPVPPPHILTSFAPPQCSSAKRGSPTSNRTRRDEEENALSPTDSRFQARLRGDDSRESVGLHDSEDYSARQMVEIRNRTGSQRTFGSASEP